MPCLSQSYGLILKTSDTNLASISVTKPGDLAMQDFSCCLSQCLVTWLARLQLLPLTMPGDLAGTRLQLLPLTMPGDLAGKTSVVASHNAW